MKTINKFKVGDSAWLLTTYADEYTSHEFPVISRDFALEMVIVEEINDKENYIAVRYKDNSTTEFLPTFLMTTEEAKFFAASNKIRFHGNR